MKYYISDLHFGHKSIITMCNRPFTDIDLMEQMLIDNWNTTIVNNDEVYFLGDFAYKCNQNKAIEILKKLNGRKYFIRGNHDKIAWLNKVKELGLIENWSDYKEINDNNRMVILCHYPLHSWNGMYRGSYHLYGHVHQNTVENLEWQKNRYNVSCEVLDYTPKTLDEIIKSPNTHIDGSAFEITCNMPVIEMSKEELEKMLDDYFNKNFKKDNNI